MPEAPAALPLPSQAKTLTRLQPDTLAALADNLSNRPPQPRKSPTQPIELRPERQSEPRVEPQPEPGIATPQPGGRPATVETASTPDEELADLARQLKAALRKPSATAARPSATAAHAASAREQAPTAEAVPIDSSPMRALRSRYDARLSTTPASVAPGPAPEQIEAVIMPPSGVPRPRTDARPPTTPARAALSPEQAPATEAVPTPSSPVRAPRPSEPEPPRSDAKPSQSKTPFDNLEQELASLLGRPTEN